MRQSGLRCLYVLVLERLVMKVLQMRHGNRGQYEGSRQRAEAAASSASLRGISVGRRSGSGHPALLGEHGKSWSLGNKSGRCFWARTMPAWNTSSRGKGNSPHHVGKKEAVPAWAEALLARFLRRRLWPHRTAHWDLALVVMDQLVSDQLDWRQQLEELEKCMKSLGGFRKLSGNWLEETKSRTKRETLQGDCPWCCSLPSWHLLIPA